MLNYIWAFMMLVSVFCATITNRMPALSESILSGAGDAVTLIISMLGMMSFWGGLMKIAEHSGITSLLSKIFSPVLKLLFPEYPVNTPASNAICMNIIANFLGLGNAATPFGIMAMKEMNKINEKPSTVTPGMAVFVVMNTASLQLIPTFLLVLRQKHRSTSPFGIIPALWITSIVSLIVGISVCKIFEKVCKE